MITSFTGQSRGHTTTWICLTPLAVDVLLTAADLVEMEHIKLTFSDPLAGVRLKRADDAGAFGVGLRPRRVGRKDVWRGTGKDKAVRDMDRAVLEKEGNLASFRSMVLAPSALAAHRLRTAASLAAAGHDVVLFVRGNALHVDWSSENCPCENCAGLAS